MDGRAPWSDRRRRVLLGLALGTVAGAALVVAVLLLLSTPDDLRGLWWPATALCTVWTAAAARAARRTDV
ncbi:hypothetical protein FHU33_0298 [Blastococcus colisei]|uniref:Uncharacterized protein n=1 Tax=Blastococcus colisei TaxID=1564162 RepID=A0A543PA37_9ACTN|nr:hypothetical protein [Blastococcus colisei]TQN40946.1 hypothetical protein FHU33_0298 [Blastococcus colisei]